MRKKTCYWSMVLVLGVVLTIGMAAAATAAVKVRVQPSGDSIPSAYVITGEERTYFGNVEGGTSGTYEYKWDFSDGASTSWANVGDPRYISINHTFAGSGLQYARLTVRDAVNTGDQGSATIQVQVLAVDTANRQKNSAVDRGLRKLYLNEIIDGSGSHWENGGYPIASTSMALIAFENHRHNLEASDDDIYKKSVQGGLQYLFNHAYSVQLSDQLCIGDPEADDGDADHDGYGIAFSCSTEGYEVPLAMLAIINSCSKSTAQSLTASSTDSFVNGMTYWDIMVDAKDFLAYAQSETGSGEFYNYCSTNDGNYQIWDDGAGGFSFYPYVSISTPTGGYCYGLNGGTYFDWNVDPSSDYFLVYFSIYVSPEECDHLRLKVDYGDATEPEVMAPAYCSPAYYSAYQYFSHEYPGPGSYTATAYWGIYDDASGETTWTEICAQQVTVSDKFLDCDDFKFKLDYGDGSEDILAPTYCYYFYAYYYYQNHVYASPGTYHSTAYYTNDDGATWNEMCGLDVVKEEAVCSENGNGWRYYRNSGDQDNSVSQWPTLALEEARDRWGILINPKVIDLMKLWLEYSQGDTSGGFGYTAPGSWENFAKTGAGLAMLKWAGYGSTDTNVQKALSFLDANWDRTCYDGNLGDFYAMYAFYKGMKYLGLSTLNTRVWEDLYSEYLVANQQTDGSWSDCGGLLPRYDFTTGAALAMLAPAVAGLPPVADADGPYGPVNPGQDVTLDGSGSFHQDPSKSLVSYEWDFDADDGLWWNTKASPDAGEGAIGDMVTTSYPDTGAEKIYTVTLRVKDNGDPQMSDTDTSTVTVQTGNVAPVAVTNGPWAGVPGDTITFDGSASYDANSCTTPGDPSCLGDSIVSYEWDLDGDGNYNEGNGDDGTPVVAGDYSKVQKTFANPVNQIVTLKVTDSYGLTGKSSPAVNIISVALVYGTDYDYCFNVVLNRFETRKGVSVTFQNLGTGTAENVIVKLTKTPTNLTILKDTASLGTLDAGEVATTQCNATTKSADIELKLDRRVIPTGEWRWKAEFDFNGKHYIVDNLPPLAPS